MDHEEIFEAQLVQDKIRMGKSMVEYGSLWVYESSIISLDGQQTTRYTTLYKEPGRIPGFTAKLDSNMTYVLERLGRPSYHGVIEAHTTVPQQLPEFEFISERGVITRRGLNDAESQKVLRALTWLTIEAEKIRLGLEGKVGGGGSNAD